MKTKLLTTISMCCAIAAMAQFGSQQIISTTTERPYLSIPFDIDNDGHMDILTASIETHHLGWYKNLDGMGNFGNENIIIENYTIYKAVEFVDFDIDGDEDMLYHKNNPSQFVWLENLDGAGNFGTPITLIEADFTGDILSIDMDNDGDLDLLAIITDTFTGWISWFENLDGQGTFGDENLFIQNDNIFSKILLRDIDNDGLMDILATDNVLWGGSIFWYKNLGNATFATAQIIYQFAYVQSGGTNITEFQYEDINMDSKLDMIITAVDENSVTTYWLENLDDQGNFSDIQFIMNSDDNYLFYDFDNDTDNDMLLWNPNTDQISWKENEDGQGTFKTPEIITTAVDFPRDAKAADFDGDGWLDVASASIADNKLAWYKNNILGISENEISDYQIYPNPTSGKLNIESKLPISQISVFNLLGQRIETTRDNNQIDLSKADAGVYLLKIEDENGNSQTHKILKE